MRGLAELDGYLGGGAGEALPGAQIKWHAIPTPIIDAEFHRDVSFGAGIGLHAGFLAIAGNGFAVDGAGAVLAADYVTPNRFGSKGADGLQDFDLLVANGGGFESGRRLERDERGELQNVALDHVAQRARGFIECGAAFDS